MHLLLGGKWLLIRLVNRGDSDLPFFLDNTCLRSIMWLVRPVGGVGCDKVAWPQRQFERWLSCNQASADDGYGNYTYQGISILALPDFCSFMAGIRGVLLVP